MPPSATPDQTVGLHGEAAGVVNASNGVKKVPTSKASVIDEILARRAKAGKLVAGVAAASDSDMWKGPVSQASALFSYTTY